MSKGFRRVAVLGVTSLGTWAVYSVGAQADERAATANQSQQVTKGPLRPELKVVTKPRAEGPSQVPGSP